VVSLFLDRRCRVSVERCLKMAQEIGSEIIMRPESFTHKASEDGRVYCKLASLLPVDYFPNVTVGDSVGDHEEESLTDNMLSMEFSYFDKYPIMESCGRDEQSSTEQPVRADKLGDSNTNQSSFKNRLKISNGSRSIKNRAAPYKLKSKNSETINNPKSSLICEGDLDISKEFKLDILTDVMQYIQNLQSLLDRDGKDESDAQDTSASSHLSKMVDPAIPQPQLPIKKTVESSQKNTNHKQASSEAESSNATSSKSVQKLQDKDCQLMLPTILPKKGDTNMEFLELKTGAITLTA